jgi:hypothetical protein
MTVVIKAVGFANGQRCPHSGQYLKSFDFEAYGGQGWGVFTGDRKKAMQFADSGAAYEFWRTVPKIRPRRSDRQPNRPLTALTIEIEPA